MNVCLVSCWRSSHFCILSLVISLLFGRTKCVELTFELEDNSKQCFFEDLSKGTKATLEYQVISGGRYDVDCYVEDQDGLKLYQEKRKQYDSHEWEATKNTTYQICFSNEFSTITHKVVYFDFSVGSEKPIVDSMDRATALSLMETACANIHEASNKVVNFQTHFRLRESLSRTFAERLGNRVQLWSLIQLGIMVIVMVGQVMILRSFFANKMNVGRRTNT
uniref:Transmembrane emp24 domain-containing protein 7 n=1 Tax=Phallusia mammillata TaxID=59560 RepID=A0A6F9DUB0_9ASCI|nr:transmembrane emp24 domain-containing protein 7 [Phallusia mammillata]